MNGTITPAILLQLDKPSSRIGYLYSVNPLLTKAILLDNVDYRFISCFGIMANPCLLQHIFLYELEDRHFTAVWNNPVIQISLDHLLLFTQRNIITFSRWRFISLFKFPAINKLHLPIGIDIFESISSIFALALSITKNAVLVISSFTAHDRAPFHKKEPRTRYTNIISCSRLIFYI